MDPVLDYSRLKQMYQKMLRIRLFEESADQLFMKGLLPGAIHTCIGQEAVAVGVGEALGPEDLVVGGHRSHGLCLIKDMDVKGMFAELMGKETGICRGKGGSMHMIDPSKGMMGANAVVGQQISIATGIAWAAQMQQTGKVCACFFGDGASNAGVFHESLNIAAIWKLPIIYVCENNKYALSTPFSEMIAVPDVAERAQAYGISGLVVDGMEVKSVYRGALTAVERARRGEGPSLIEAKTYRFLGHSRGDPPYGPYRTKEEVEAWKKRDPLRGLEAELGLSSEEIDGMRKLILEEYGAAIQFAMESPYPETEASLHHIYA